jgi:hypothetical protein
VIMSARFIEGHRDNVMRPFGMIEMRIMYRGSIN